MKIQATDKRLKVAFRVDGKHYGHGGFDPALGIEEYPFDEIDVEVGESWELPAGGTLVFVRQYEPIPGLDISVSSPA